jgi:ribosomal protein L11 methylase PrmA
VFVVATKDNVISRLLFLEGHYQLDLVQRSFGLLRELHLIPARGKGTLLDIGANNGVISIGALVCNEVAAVIGLEPEPDNVALLRRNIEKNSLSHQFVAL